MFWLSRPAKGSVQSLNSQEFSDLRNGLNSCEFGYPEIEAGLDKCEFRAAFIIS